MKLEVGMHIRINGFISKIGHINTTKKGNTYIQFKQPNGLLITMNTKFLDDEKASHNILELIEPMDLMFIDISPDDCGGIVVPRIAETINELEQWKERIFNKNCILKYVLTREQIESGRYKVGE